MSRSKNAKTRIDKDTEDALSELFADSDHANYFDFDSVELAPFRRIATAATAMGGMVALYSSGDGNGVVISVRIGERTKRYEFASPDEWDTFIEQIANPWYAAFGRWLAAKKADELLADDADKKGKKT